MLKTKRRLGEKLYVGDMAVTVAEVGHNSAVLALDGPAAVPITRGETLPPGGRPRPDARVAALCDLAERLLAMARVETDEDREAVRAAAAQIQAARRGC